MTQLSDSSFFGTKHQSSSVEENQRYEKIDFEM